MTRALASALAGGGIGVGGEEGAEDAVPADAFDLPPLGVGFSSFCFLPRPGFGVSGGVEVVTLSFSSTVDEVGGTSGFSSG